MIDYLYMQLLYTASGQLSLVAELLLRGLRLAFMVGIGFPTFIALFHMVRGQQQEEKKELEQEQDDQEASTRTTKPKSRCMCLALVTALQLQPVAAVFYKLKAPRKTRRTKKTSSTSLWGLLSILPTNGTNGMALQTIAKASFLALVWKITIDGPAWISGNDDGLLGVILEITEPIDREIDPAWYACHQATQDWKQTAKLPEPGTCDELLRAISHVRNHH